jgi:hypothetical protein
MYVWDELEAWTQDRGVILVDIIRLGGAGRDSKRVTKLLEKNFKIVGKEGSNRWKRILSRFELASSDSVVLPLPDSICKRGVPSMHVCGADFSLMAAQGRSWSVVVYLAHADDDDASCGVPLFCTTLYCSVLPTDHQPAFRILWTRLLTPGHDLALGSWT